MAEVTAGRGEGPASRGVLYAGNGYDDRRMRTSPPHVRLTSARRALAALAACGMALVATACSDDEPEPRSTPTTTVPDDGTTTESTTTTADEGESSSTTTATAPGASTTTAPPQGSSTTSIPAADTGQPALTSAEAQAVIRQLMDRYRAALADAKASNADEEGLLVGLSNVYDGSAARTQVDGLISFGGLGVVRPNPAAPEVGVVEVVDGAATCVSGTVRVILDPLFTKSVGARQPHSFRLEPAGQGAPAPAWRLSYLSFSSRSAYTEEAACPE